MGPGELWGRWHLLADRVNIAGTKRDGRVRDVPWCPPSGNRRGYQAFRAALHEASSGSIEPYDLRRTYANWLEAAGIPRTRRRLYLGHGVANVTYLYERHHVAAFLAEDAERLQGVLGEVVATALRVVK